MATLLELSKALGPFAGDGNREAWTRRNSFPPATEGERKLAARAKGDVRTGLRTIRARELRRVPRLP
jgi:hypothetical protein